MKRPKDIFLRKDLRKIVIVVEYSFISESTLMRYEERPSNIFSRLFHTLPN